MKKGMTTVLTAKHFKLFEDEVKKWVDRFNLNDTFLLIRHSNLNGMLGELNYSYKARTATIFLAKKPKYPIITNMVESEIKKTAFHEVCELLLIRIGVLAEDRSWDQAEFESETHAVIARLENYLKPEGE